MLGVMTLLLGGVVVFFAFGQALGSKGRHQRAVDLAAVSGAQVMRDLYPRLFEPRRDLGHRPRPDRDRRAPPAPPALIQPGADRDAAQHPHGRFGGRSSPPAAVRALGLGGALHRRQPPGLRGPVLELSSDLLQLGGTELVLAPHSSFASP
jgi:hypothetical protein